MSTRALGHPRARTPTIQNRARREAPMLIALLQAVASGLAVGGAYALIALGFSITFTTTKTLNFSHGEFVSAGAFIGMSALFLVLGKPFDSTTFANAVPGAGAQLFALVLAWSVL